MSWFDWSKRTHKGLRHWILYVVRDSPKNGAEIMDALEGMSQGWWRPSPGSVYPQLESMANEGLVRRLDDGRYELTTEGREDIEWPMSLRGGSPKSMEEVLDQLSSYVSYLEDLKKTKGPELASNSVKLKELRDRLSRLGSQ